MGLSFNGQAWGPRIRNSEFKSYYIWVSSATIGEFNSYCVRVSSPTIGWVTHSIAFRKWKDEDAPQMLCATLVPWILCLSTEKIDGITYTSDHF